MLLDPGDKIIQQARVRPCFPICIKWLFYNPPFPPLHSLPLPPSPLSLSVCVGPRVQYKIKTQFKKKAQREAVGGGRIEKRNNGGRLVVQFCPQQTGQQGC